MGKSPLEVTLSAATLAAVDEWQIKTNTPSRAAAIRELLRRGVTAERFENSDGEKRGCTHSTVG